MTEMCCSLMSTNSIILFSLDASRISQKYLHTRIKCVENLHIEVICVYVATDKCENFCQNNGVCKKNEDGEPYCVCSGSFTGNKCHVSVMMITQIKIQTYFY